MSPSTIRSWLGAERGASAISLLAALAALAGIAALMIPALSKSGTTPSAGQPAAATAQAQDVQAKNLLVDAQTAMATYSASSGNGYTGATPAALGQIEPTLITASTNQAYIASVSATSDSFTVVAANPLTWNTFTLVDTGGALTRTCTVAGRGGCLPGGTW